MEGNSMATGATGGATAAAAIIQAIKASGAIVNVSPADFEALLSRVDNPLVVVSEEKFFKKTSYKYLTSYKGLAFFTKSRDPLQIDSRAEIVGAKKIWIPG